MFIFGVVVGQKMSGSKKLDNDDILAFPKEEVNLSLGVSASKVEYHQVIEDIISEDGNIYVTTFLHYKNRVSLKKPT